MVEFEERLKQYKINQLCCCSRYVAYDFLETLFLCYMHVNRFLHCSKLEHPKFQINNKPQTVVVLQVNSNTLESKSNIMTSLPVLSLPYKNSLKSN